MFDEKFFDSEEIDTKTQKLINTNQAYELDVDKFIRASK
ncbi:hypothetical protein C7391_0925 [Methanimicrococcus blatticola]|uniref:Uncharacterized protein n=1 Tax=Methanimicrococcus blatticola TaxID=91560 RepID=A0A484F3I0_9EURY|nr:hypothetical protein C7391_0925 [Methanimicrococcus blatticola]